MHLNLFSQTLPLTVTLGMFRYNDRVLDKARDNYCDDYFARQETPLLGPAGSENFSSRGWTVSADPMSQQYEAWRVSREAKHPNAASTSARPFGRLLCQDSRTSQLAKTQRNKCVYAAAQVSRGTSYGLIRHGLLSYNIVTEKVTAARTTVLTCGSASRGLEKGPSRCSPGGGLR